MCAVTTLTSLYTLTCTVNIFGLWDAGTTRASHNPHLLLQTFLFYNEHIFGLWCRYYQAADIWAFGILLMELATGHAPYANFSLTNIIIMTMHSPVPELERTFSDVSAFVLLPWAIGSSASSLLLSLPLFLPILLLLPLYCN